MNDINVNTASTQKSKKPPAMTKAQIKKMAADLYSQAKASKTGYKNAAKQLYQIHKKDPKTAGEILDKLSSIADEKTDFTAYMKIEKEFNRIKESNKTPREVAKDKKILKENFAILKGPRASIVSDVLTAEIEISALFVPGNKAAAENIKELINIYETAPVIDGKASAFSALCRAYKNKFDCKQFSRKDLENYLTSEYKKALKITENTNHPLYDKVVRTYNSLVRPNLWKGTTPTIETH